MSEKKRIFTIKNPKTGKPVLPQNTMSFTEKARSERGKQMQINAERQKSGKKDKRYSLRQETQLRKYFWKGLLF